jgi:hypothetical protein
MGKVCFLQIVVHTKQDNKRQASATKRQGNKLCSPTVTMANNVKNPLKIFEVCRTLNNLGIVYLG